LGKLISRAASIISSEMLNHHAPAEHFDIDRHTPAGEHAWYSDSGSVKHQDGLSTFSIGALMVAEKLD
jgi:hypothetical protein